MMDAQTARDRILFAAFGGWSLGIGTVMLLVGTEPGKWGWHILPILAAIACMMLTIRSLLPKTVNRERSDATPDRR